MSQSPDQPNEVRRALDPAVVTLGGVQHVSAAAAAFGNALPSLPATASVNVAAQVLAALPDPAAALRGSLRNITASIDTTALTRSIARTDESMDALRKATRERSRREAAVEQATLNVAEATAQLVKVAQAQNDAINTLVAETRASAVTEARHFRITLPVLLIGAAAAIAAAVVGLLALN